MLLKVRKKFALMKVYKLAFSIDLTAIFYPDCKLLLPDVDKAFGTDIRLANFFINWVFKK